MRAAKRLIGGVLVALLLAVVLGWLASCSHPPSYSPTAPTSTAPAPTPPPPAPSPAPSPEPAPAPAEWHPGRAAVLDIKADFVGNVDAEGRVMFDIFLPGLTAEQQADWIARRKAEGATHLVIGADGWNYPGYPAPSGTWTPAQLAAFVAHLLDDEHLIPIIAMNGDAVSDQTIDATWPPVLEALQPRQADLIVFPCFECSGSAGQLDDGYANAVLRHYLPQAVLGVEPAWTALDQPRHPITGDWDVELYEAPNEQNDAVLLREPCSPTDHTGCWLSQLRDELGDQGVGRPPNFCLFEICAYARYTGRATDADCHRLTAEGLQVCQQMGRTCSYGNGAPQ